MSACICVLVLFQYCIEAELPGFKKDDVKVNLRPGGILTICACVSEQLKKGVEPAQLQVPVKEQQTTGLKEKEKAAAGRQPEIEQQTTGQQPAEPQQTEPQKGRRDQPAEKELELLEEKVAEPQPQQAQVQPTYAQRVAHEQPGQQGQLGVQLQGQQPQLHREQKEQQQPEGEAQLQPQQAQLQYVRQERVVAPAHRVIKVRTSTRARRGRQAPV